MASPPQITPNVVWNHDGVDCEFGDTGCLIKAMKAGGASSEAVRLAEWLIAQDDPGWADSFKEFGRVDLINTFHQFRANTLDTFYLVNGSPGLVKVDGFDLTAADRPDPTSSRC